MDFDLTDEQERYRQSVRRFAEQELNDDVLGRDARHEFSRDGWERAARFGIHGLPVPKEYGGSGADTVTVVTALEALGRGCSDSGLLFALSAQMWSCEIPLVKFGSEEQKQRYLPGLCDGSLMGVHAMTEPGSGSDAFSLTTTATKKRGTYVLNGTKTFITNAPLADVFVIFATLDPAKGWSAVSAFLVDRDNPGLTVGQPFRKMGLRTCAMSEVTLSDCEVGPQGLLAREGAGMAVFNHSIDWERSFILATAVGTMARQLQRTVEFARQREQFGQAIGKFQSVANHVVDMKVRLETSRLLIYHLAWLKNTGRSTALESAMAKLYVSECYVQSGLAAVQVHGGRGYLEEAEIERDLRDAVGSRIYSGTSEIQRNIVARHLGL